MEVRHMYGPVLRGIHDGCLMFGCGSTEIVKDFISELVCFISEV